MRSLVASLSACALAGLISVPATAGECSHNPDALGTARVLKVDTSDGPRLGTLQYRQTLELGPKEVVLTFDDGPHKPNTARILDALDKECVKATFFPVGIFAKQNAELMRKIAEKGHTIGGHSWSHPYLHRLSFAAGKSEIERGFKAVHAAVGQPIAPFFRFPGLNDTSALNAYAAKRDYAVFSCDIGTDDWRGISADKILRRTMSRLDERGRGMLLFHDTKAATAAALPKLLKALKRGGYKIVHIVPETPISPAGPGKADIASAETPAAAPAAEPAATQAN